MHCRPFVDGQEDREGVARLWEIKEDWAQLATKMRTYGPSSSYPALVLAEHDGQIFGAIEGCMDADLSEKLAVVNRTPGQLQLLAWPVQQAKPLPSSNG